MPFFKLQNIFATYDHTKDAIDFALAVGKGSPTPAEVTTAVMIMYNTVAKLANTEIDRLNAIIAQHEQGTAANPAPATSTEHRKADDGSYLYSFSSITLPSGKVASMKWYQNGSGEADVFTYDGISDENDVIATVLYGWAYPPTIEQQTAVIEEKLLKAVMGNKYKVALIQDPYRDETGYCAAGYLHSEDSSEETAPTVSVYWTIKEGCELLDDASEMCDWDNPSLVIHCRLGDITGETTVTND